MREIGVLLAMRGPQEAEFFQQINNAPAMSVMRRCADASEVLAAAIAGVGDLAVIDAGLGVNRSLLERLTEVGVVPVVVSSMDDVTSYAGIGASVVPYGIEDLAQRLLDIIDTHEVRPATPAPEPATLEAQQGEIVSIMSAWGGPGRTTVAVNLAAELAARGANPLLIDADVWGASIKQYLGLDPDGSGIAAAMRGVERGTFDMDGLLRLTEERFGIRVLGGLNKSDRWAEVSTPALHNFWEIVSEWPGHVIVDAPVQIPGDNDLGGFGPARNAMWSLILEVSDSTCMVASADTVGIHRFINFHLDAQVPATHVIVNRVRSAAAGPGARQSVEELLARFAGIDNPLLLPEDPAVDKAILECAPVRNAAARSPIAQAFVAVADQFLPTRARGRKPRLWRRAKSGAH